MLALEQHQQAAFVGVRSTFYRIAMITGQGALIIFAGYIESHSGLPPVEIKINAEYSNVSINLPISINDEIPSKKISELQIYSTETNYKINTTPISKQKFDSLTSSIKNKNIENGFASKPKEVIKISEESFWEQNVSKPLARYLRETFNPDKVKSVNEKGNIILIPFRISQKLEQGREVVFTFSHLRGDNNFSVIEGERFVFTSENWDKVAFAVVQVDYKLKQNSDATFVGKSGNIPLSWSITFFLLTGIFISLAIYHKFVLPYPVSDKPIVSDPNHNVLKEFLDTFGSFFKKKDIGIILGFLLLYRFAEAQLVKLIAPFLLDPRVDGGLGLTTQEVGIVYGTVGVIALTLGGLLGGVVIAKRGLKFWLWIMVCVIHLPDAMFIYLSQFQPESFYLIGTAVAIEQFGYGFGFTAYMLFMIMVSEGEHKTAHYAICTGFMALGMMLPGMFSGWLQDQIGYQHFFLWVMVSTIPGFVIAAFVKIPEGFGKKKE